MNVQLELSSKQVDEITVQNLKNLVYDCPDEVTRKSLLKCIQYLTLSEDYEKWVKENV